MQRYAAVMTVLIAGVLGMVEPGCGNAEQEQADDARWHMAREAMVRTIEAYGLHDQQVLQAMRRVKRHRYIPPERHGCDPYGDHPCPIGYGQTISQPFIVAYMTAQMHITSGEKVLEIGTGSGYQAAVLAALGARVYSIEIVPELAGHARRVLAQQGWDVQVRTGDGYLGWPEEAPFDVVIVTCAPEDIPRQLVAQLAEGGRMIVPAGHLVQQLYILHKRNGQITTSADIGVRFVPMVGGEP